MRASGLSLSVVVIAGLLFFPARLAQAQSCPVNSNITGSITAGDPTQSNRIFRTGVPSDCNGKAVPGLNDTNPQDRNFDSYTFTNTNPTPACIEVTMTGTIAGLESVAYVGSFVPSNVQANYAGDLGVVYTANTTASYSFTVPAGQNFTVVVHEVGTNTPANSYTLAIDCTAPACPVGASIAGSIAVGDFTQTNRVTRTGVSSDCNSKVFPGPNDGGTPQSRRFDQYIFTNMNATAACIEVLLNGTINGLHSVAYLNSFDPANIQTNYLGDLGTIYSANTNASYLFSVPAGASFIVVVHETTANGPANSYKLEVDCSPYPPPFPAPGQMLISEFRLSGPGSSGLGSTKDDFIELYNNTDAPLSIGRFRIGFFSPNIIGPGNGADGFRTLPPVIILPPRAHYLVADTTAGAAADSYSLSGYATANHSINSGTGQADDVLIDNEGIQIVTPQMAASQAVIDSVGFSGSGGRPGEVIVYPEGTPLPRRTQTNPTVQYSYVRRLTSGTPQDTDNNAADFALISTNASVFNLAAGGTTPSTLGAPGPENIASPIHNSAPISVALLDPLQPADATPNQLRLFNSGGMNATLGTFFFRRTFTNNTGANLTRLRFRIIDLTTSPTSPSAGDLRALSSTSVTVTVTGVGPVTVQGTTVETPPAQANGGGLNTTFAAGTITPGTPLAQGASVNLQFQLGVEKEGLNRFAVIAEALPGGGAIFEVHTFFGFTSITRLPDQHILLQARGVANGLHTIKASPDLNPNNFGLIGTATANSAGVLQFNDAGAVGLTLRFYRLEFP